MFKKLASLTENYSWGVITVSLVLLALAGWFGPSLFNQLTDKGFYANGSESVQAQQIIDDKFSHLSTDAVALLASNDGSKVSDASYRKAAGEVVEQIEATPGVDGVDSYYKIKAENLVSADQTKTILGIHFDPNEQSGAVATRLRENVTSNKLELKFSGTAFLVKDISQQIKEDLMRAEIVSFAILSVLLVVIFRGLIAAAIPLLLGVFTIVVSFLLLRGAAEFMSISQYAVNVIIALGLGLSIDYSLLIVSRFREELLRHNSIKKALATTMQTAGHTVFFSGLTVIICLLSLVFFPLDMLRSMGVGGAAAVALAMIAGLILLPAILALLGKNINKLSLPQIRRSTKAETRSFWYRLAGVIGKRPVIFTVVVTAFLVAAGLPLADLEFTQVNQQQLPASSTTRQVLDTIAADFATSSNDVQIIYKTNQLQSNEAIANLYDYTKQLKQVENVSSVYGLTALNGVKLTKAQYQALISQQPRAPTLLGTQIDKLIRQDSTIINLSLKSNITDVQVNQAIEDLRQIDSTKASVYVGGFEALSYDQVRAIKQTLPWAILWIVVAIYVLIFLMLGSVILPLQAIVMNALSLTVALGAVVWIFHDGHLAEFLGLNAQAGIDVTAPLIIFAIAFGLSMDYSVFLYGRIKEEYVKLADNKQAIAAGLDKTGGIITAAAFLLFIVVAAFVTSEIAIMQQIGFGLAVAVLVDAFLIRVILVPSVMTLFGRANWWSPKFLKRLTKRL